MENKLRIHFAFFSWSKNNTYPYDLVDSIRNLGHEVTYGLDIFWNPVEKYNIVHIHWPEALFKWECPTIDQINHLEKILKYYKHSSTRIISTRHNYTRHVVDGETTNKNNFEILYNLVYTYSDGIIHLGQFSKTEFQERYSMFENIQHVVIPHGLYKNYKNDSNREESRKILKIDYNKKVILTFGWIRNFNETRFIKKVFENTQLENKLLIAPRWHFGSNRFVKLFRKTIYELKSNYCLHDQIVPNDEVQYYLKASDIVFIPRLQNLNSGVLILAFSFGKVVVGPNKGVMGEILLETGNPTFDPEDIKSISEAIIRGTELAKAGKGAKNLEYATKNWNWDKIGKMHNVFYNQIFFG